MIKIQKTDWNLSPLLKNESEIPQKLEKIKKAHENFVNKWKNNPEYLRNPKILKNALDDLENLEKNFGLSGDAGFYFTLKHSINQADPEIKAKLNKVEELEKTLLNNMNFFTLNISKIPKETQSKFLKDAELKEYRHFLERLFSAAQHTLSEPEEKILTLKQSVAHDFWERMTSSLLTKQEKEINIKDSSQKKNFSELLNLNRDDDKKVREESAKAVNEILSQYSEVAEAEMNAIMANKKINDELRKFSRADSSRHLNDDVSSETVDKLIQTVTENFEVSKRFFRLKTKILKVSKLKYYERNVRIGEDKTKYSYQDSINLIHKTFLKLDKKFSDILEMYIKNSQIDVYPKKGKQNGAFCSHLLPIQPTFIMLNHDDTLDAVTTIAHEVGHGINSELMKKSQNALNIGTPKSTAEVASTFMEDFVFEELLKESSDEKKLTILMEKLNGDVSTIFRQTAFYNFEFELHTLFRKKGYLSKEEIGELFKKHMSSYMGAAVDVSEAGNWWVYIPHFRYLFYVYSYASGLLISKALQKKVRENHADIEKVKEFLSAGTSDSPENIFKKMNIDITKKEFWISGIKEINSLLEETEKLAKKLNK